MKRPEIIEIKLPSPELVRLTLYTEHAAKVGRVLGIRLAQARGAKRP
jgi:hypothetical protein